MRPERVAMMAEVSVRRRSDSRYSVKLLDFSIGGCRVEMVQRVKAGDLIWISLPGIETIEGTVRWVEGFVAGVSFNNPLYPSVFEMLAGRLKKSP